MLLTQGSWGEVRDRHSTLSKLDNRDQMKSRRKTRIGSITELSNINGLNYGFHDITITWYFSRYVGDYSAKISRKGLD